MSDLVSGGNVTARAANFRRLSPRGKFSLLSPFLLPLFLLIVGATNLVGALQANLSPMVTSTATVLKTRVIASNSAADLSHGLTYMSFGATLLCIYGFMILPAFTKKVRIHPRLAFIIAFGVGLALLLPSFYVRPDTSVQTKVVNWGSQQLQIYDLNDYYTVKNDIKQTFTVKNAAGKEVTFSMTSTANANYVYTTYTKPPTTS